MRGYDRIDIAKLSDMMVFKWNFDRKLEDMIELFGGSTTLLIKPILGIIYMLNLKKVHYKVHYKNYA
jgi:hypothetical protein